MEDDSEAEAEAERAEKEARAAAAMAEVEAAFAIDDGEESDVEDATFAADAGDAENHDDEVLVGADGINPIKNVGRNKDGRQGRKSLLQSIFSHCFVVPPLLTFDLDRGGGLST